VLPPHYLHPTSGTQPNVVAPIVLTPELRDSRARRSFSALVRLPAGVRLADYQARFTAVSQRVRAELPPSQVNAGLGHWDVAFLEPLGDRLVRGQGDRFAVVFATVGGLLLLGCLNVSGLVASRGIDRARELGLRRAIGAQGRHIARLVIAETGLVVAAGAALGLLLTPLLLQTTTRLLPQNQTLLKTPALDWRVAGFALIVTAIAVLCVSVWPIVQGLREPAAAAGAVRARTTTTDRSRGRRAIIAAQVALGFVLALGGSLLVASLVTVWRTDVGFSTGGVIVASPVFSLGPNAALEEQRLARDEIIARLRAIPGVTAVGASGSSLLRNSYPGGMWRADTHAVTDGFFEAAGLRTVRGRTLSAGEVSSGAAVAVLSERMAETSFPDGPAVGRELVTLDGRASYTVVGVVEDARLGRWDYTGMGEGQVYLPLGGRPRSIAIRTGGNAGDVLGRVLAVADAMPGVRWHAAALADDLLDETIRDRRFQAWVFGAFAAAALVIVGAGCSAWWRWPRPAGRARSASGCRSAPPEATCSPSSCSRRSRSAW
jgi:ABC-type antimicrobial peptide transport system permease subunit